MALLIAAERVLFACYLSKIEFYICKFVQIML